MRRHQHIPDADAAGHRFGGRPDVVEPAQGEQTVERCADVGHRQRLADARLHQAENHRIGDALPFLLDDDFDDGLTDESPAPWLGVAPGNAKCKMQNAK